MKNLTESNRSPVLNIAKTKIKNDLNQGIKKRLLDKYKPRERLSTIDTIKTRQDQRRMRS